MKAKTGDMPMDKWDKRFMEVASLIATWASCYQAERKIGAVIVKNKRILTTGYNGAPAGIRTCVERGECMRKKQGIASGTRHELCATPSTPSRTPSSRRRNWACPYRTPRSTARTSPAPSARR